MEQLTKAYRLGQEKLGLEGTARYFKGSWCGGINIEIAEEILRNAKDIREKSRLAAEAIKIPEKFMNKIALILGYYNTLELFRVY